jgi:hypothetical protein
MDMEDLKTETVTVSKTNKVHFSEPSSTIQLSKHSSGTVQLEPQTEPIKTIKQQ